MNPDIHQHLVIDGDADELAAVKAALESQGLTVYAVPTQSGQAPRIGLDPAHMSMALTLIQALDLPASADVGQDEQHADAPPKKPAHAAAPPARGSAAGSKAEQP